MAHMSLISPTRLLTMGSSFSEAIVSGAKWYRHGPAAGPQEIFPLCATMYGVIACAWMSWFWYHRRDPSLRREQEQQAVVAYVLLLCVTWCSFSVGMHVLNKSLASSLESPAIISIVQMLIAVGIMAATSWSTIRQATFSQVKIWLIVPIFFAGMLCSSFYTYQYISLSMLTVVRNLTPLVVLPLELLIMPRSKQPKVTFLAVSAILTMLAGTVVYTGGLDSLSVIGVCFAILNMLLAVSDRLIQRRLLTEECKGLPSSACTMINNSLGIFPCIALMFITSELQGMAEPEHVAHWSDWRVVLLLIVSGFVGLGICYLGFECQRVISATSFFVMQNVSKIAVVSAGIIFFHDPIRSPLVVLGLVMSLGGSLIYSWEQTRQNAQKAAAKDGKAEETTPLKPEDKEKVNA